jgi:cytochrome P450
MVVKESMRLYPPAWLLSREAKRDFEVYGYSIRKGAQVLMSQWVMHRDARYFDRPEEFRPERWADEQTKSLPRFAYFPFGGGPRVCIGTSYAMMEAILILATTAQRHRARALDRTRYP